MTDNDLLTPEQLSQLLGFALPTLQTWRARKQGPPYLKLGHRTIRYRRSDVEAWIVAQDEALRARGEREDD